MNHTPGLWKQIQYDGATYIRDSRRPLFRVCASTVQSLESPGHREECRLEDQSYTRLVAAAPDLLDALKAVVGANQIQDPFESRQRAFEKAMFSIIAAIEKAEGK